MTDGPASETWDAEHLARAMLSAICPPADPRLGGLVAQHGACAVLAALRRLGDESAWGRRAVALDPDRLIGLAGRAGLRFVIPGDREWPAVLDDLDGCAPLGGMTGRPIGLWLAGPGHLTDWVPPAVAVVGARAATRYGEAVATSLAAELATGEGYSVISGGAYGVDAAAHRGALAAGGRTIGVYAGGLDEPYPRGNTQLFERLTTSALVVSEVAPGVRAHRAGFLARNRLIAALGLGTVVVEAALRSGARNTAHWAANLGRMVMAVPGSVHSEQSAGCHRMITDQEATLVAGIADVRALLAPVGQAPEPPNRGPQRLLDGLDTELLAVREAMPGRRSVSVAELSLGSGRSVPQTIAALTQLELLGLVRRDTAGGWRLRNPGR